MHDQELWNVLLYRYSAVCRVEALLDDEESLSSALAKVARFLASQPTKYRPPTARTLEGWYYRFQRNGKEGLMPRRRNDRGSFRRIDPDVACVIEEILDALREAIPEKQRREKKRLTTGEELHETLIARKAIASDVSLSTLYRFLRAHDIKLLIGQGKDRHRWEGREPNHTWQSDGFKGSPAVLYKGRTRRTVVISIMDDYSRFILAGKVFFTENARNFLEVYREALCRRGIPHRVFVDNGGAFNAREVVELSLRLDLKHISGTPDDAPPRGKIERWHRSLRGSWVRKARQAKIRSLSALNQSLQVHIEEYNNRRHRTTGMTPHDRWLKGNWTFRPVQDKGSMRDIFGKRLRRRVDRAACVQVGNALYEVSQTLRGKWVTVVYLADMPDEVDVHTQDYTGTGKRLRFMKGG